MTSVSAEQLHQRLEDRFGDALRSVGYYDGDENEMLYVRDDVDEEYDDADVEHVFRKVRLEAIDYPNQESLYTHGELQCTFRCFEAATELHVSATETTGVVAAVDAGAIDDLRETAATCVDAIES